MIRAPDLLGRATRLVEPTATPIGIEDLKAHSRLEDVDIGVLYGYILAATAHVERQLQRSLMPQAWQVTFDGGFPAEIRLRYPPVQSITSVAYVDADGVTQTLDAADYRLARSGEMGARIIPAYGTTWPAPRDVLEAVTVVYQAGYTVVPYDIRHAIRLLAAHWVEHREAAMEGREMAPMPMGVEEILRPHVIYTVA